MIEKVTIKFNGEYHEIQAAELDMSESPTDAEVRQAVVQHLEVDSLSEFVVEPPENDVQRQEATVLSLRPTATYGTNELA